MKRSLEKLRMLLGPSVELSLVERRSIQEETCPELIEGIVRIVDSCSKSHQEVQHNVTS